VSTVVSNSSISSSMMKCLLHRFVILACSAVAGGPRSNNPATGAYSANDGVKNSRDASSRESGVRVSGVSRGWEDIERRVTTRGKARESRLTPRLVGLTLKTHTQTGWSHTRDSFSVWSKARDSVGQIGQRQVTRAVSKADAKKAVGGADGISLKFIKSLWPVLAVHITKIAQMSVPLNYHPPYFKLAIIAILRKDNRKEYKIAKSYQKRHGSQYIDVRFHHIWCLICLFQMIIFIT
jgi:hypothetical protein